MSKHTPPPWNFSEQSQGSQITIWGKVRGDFHAIASVGYNHSFYVDAQANAAFIVRAVNCHTDLVEAAKTAATVLAGYELSKSALSDALHKLRDALKKASEP